MNRADDFIVETPSPDEVEAGRSPAGGFTKATLARLGRTVATAERLAEATGTRLEDVQRVGRRRRDPFSSPTCAQKEAVGRVRRGSGGGCASWAASLPWWCTAWLDVLKNWSSALSRSRWTCLMSPMETSLTDCANGWNSSGPETNAGRPHGRPHKNGSESHYSTRRSCDGAIAGGDGESSSAPLTRASEINAGPVLF